MIIVLPVSGWWLLAFVVFAFVCCWLSETGCDAPPQRDTSTDAADDAAERARWTPAFEGDTFEWSRDRNQV